MKRNLENATFMIASIFINGYIYKYYQEEFETIILKIREPLFNINYEQLPLFKWFKDKNSKKINDFIEKAFTITNNHNEKEIPNSIVKDLYELENKIRVYIYDTIYDFVKNI